MDCFVIINENNQPVYFGTKDDKRVWLFVTEQDAESFLNRKKRKAVDQKLGKTRNIVEAKLLFLDVN